MLTARSVLSCTAFSLAMAVGRFAPGIAPGTALAAVATNGYCGYLAGPPLIGLAADLVGLRAALGIVCAACGLVAAGAAMIRRLVLLSPRRETS